MRIRYLVLWFGLASFLHAQSKCGVERWAVKTLADSEASKITSTVTDSTIEKLRNEPAPTDLKAQPDHRHSPVELTRYRIHALLLGFKRENDRDYHLVLASPQDKSITMVAEIPSGTCTPASISKQEAMLQTWLVKKFGHPKAPVRMLKLHPPRRVVVEGIGFFDFLHGQTGVAPNGIEIHPITKIDLDHP